MNFYKLRIYSTNGKINRAQYKGNECLFIVVVSNYKDCRYK